MKITKQRLQILIESLDLYIQVNTELVQDLRTKANLKKGQQGQKLSELAELQQDLVLDATELKSELIANQKE